MTVDAPANFDTKNEALVKKPVYYISITGESIDYSTGRVVNGNYTFAENATVYASYADGQAFVIVDGEDLTPYVGLKIIITDSAGKTAYGWISEADSAESLGSELITNGDMELDSNWINYGDPSLNERSGAQKHGGSYSRKFTADDNDDGIQSDNFSTTIKKLYKVVAWVYPDDQTKVRVSIRKGDNSGWALKQTPTTLIQDAWNQLIYFYTEIAGGAGSYMVFECAESIGDWYVDDVSEKEVTNIGATGVRVTKTPGGSEGWNIESGFDVNDQGNYTVEIYNKKQYMLTPKGNSQSITPEKGQSSIGYVVIPLQDRDDEITTLVAGTLDAESVITLVAGYEGLAEADFIDIFKGRVSKITLSDDATHYLIEVSDLQRPLKKDIFTYGDDNTNAIGSGNKRTITAQNPLTVLLNVLTTTAAGTNGDYDLGYDGFGLGIDEADIDITAIEAERDLWIPDDQYTFSYAEKVMGKDFLEQEILKTINGYFVITGDGKLSVKLYSPPIPADAAVTLTNSNIIGVPKWDRNLSAVINNITFRYDYDEDNDTFDSGDVTYTDATSIAKHGLSEEFVIESKGIRTALNGANLTEQRALRFFLRWADPPPIVEVETFFEKRLTEVGDMVDITHPYIPDMVNSAMGITNDTMEVIELQPEFEKGRIAMTLMQTGFSGKRYAVIGSTEVEYTAATDAQKKYGFICDTDNEMSNGDPCYRIF